MFLNNVDLTNKSIVLRCDYNVPIKNNKILSTKRIDASFKTLQFILNQNIKKLIIISHLGRPKNKEKKFSLIQIKKYLEKMIKKNIFFSTLETANNIDEKIILLENIRFYKEETKMLDTTPKFRKNLSSLGDVFINDAFGCCHRNHSSIVGINIKERYLGFIVEKELKYLNIFNDVKGKKSLILGGSKVIDKIPLIKNLIDKVDNILIGGGMVFAFLYHKNINIGKSILDKESLQYIDEIYTLANKHNTNIVLPVDFKCNDDFSNTGDIINVDVKDGIPNSHMGLDIGKKTIRLFNIALYSSHCIVWNGPLGVTEFSNFETGSRNVMRFISILDTKSIIGGGDTASACEQFNLQNEMTHVSTGGGASLEVLEGKTLPGIAFVKQNF